MAKKEKQKGSPFAFLLLIIEDYKELSSMFIQNRPQFTI